MKKEIICASSAFGLSALILWFSSFPVATKLMKMEDASVKEYVETNLEKIIEMQEKEISLSYPSKEIDIVYTIDSSPSEVNFGLYKSSEDKIYLASGLLTEEENKAKDWAKIIFTFGDTENIKKVLDHELGHYYCDKLSESIGNGNWPPTLEEKSLFYKGELAGIRLVSEGIAEYINRTMNKGIDNYKYEDFSKIDWNLAENNEFLLYDPGYHLVKPIIDKHGEEGIKALILNPPKGKDLEDLPAYRSKFLEMLK